MPSYGYSAVSYWPGSHRAFFLSRNDREYGESIMHPDIVLLVVLAALAVWTEVDKLWRRRMPQ
jgi:hypothetical protein